jgi:hypothetical protein
MTEVTDAEQAIIAAALAIVPGKLAPSDLPQAKEIVVRAKSLLDLQVAQIRQDLGFSGPAENARWWASATAAQRTKGQQRQRLDPLHAEVNRLIRAERNKQNGQKEISRERRFIELAKEHLPKATFLELWQIVNKEFGEE